MTLLTCAPHSSGKLNGAQFLSQLKRLGDEQPGHELTVDLSAVDDIDISGLTALLVAEDHLRRQGGSLVIQRPSPGVLKVLRLVRPAVPHWKEENSDDS